jgi:hypothetical protein
MIESLFILLPFHPIIVSFHVAIACIQLYIDGKRPCMHRLVRRILYEPSIADPQSLSHSRRSSQAPVR